MSYTSPRISAARISLSCALLLAILAPSLTNAQIPGQQPADVNVTMTTQRIEMTVNTSRLLTLGQAIPRAQVNNPEVLELAPLSAKQLQIYAKKTGVTQINLFVLNQLDLSARVDDPADSRGDADHNDGSEEPDLECDWDPHL